MNNIDVIIDLCYVDDNKKNNLRTSLDNYRRAFAILRKKDDDYTEKELANYKIFMNSFTTIMVKVYGRKFLPTISIL